MDSIKTIKDGKRKPQPLSQTRIGKDGKTKQQRYYHNQRKKQGIKCPYCGVVHKCQEVLDKEKAEEGRVNE